MHSVAEINNNLPPLSLTLSQVEQWTPNSKFADKNNIAKVLLQKRFVAQLDEEHPLDAEVKVLIAPDGMNNLGNYLQEQNKFNLYNFTHWPHIDVLNWFAGTANETVSIPAKPWVEVAHRNGVKVIGTVYLAVAQYQGEVSTVQTLLSQDLQGRFPYAHKLIELAEFYGFDGWLINPETDLTLVKNAQGQIIKDKYEYQQAAILGKKTQAFMRYLTKLAPKGMEIHWYDAMLLDGSVKWQNQLNQNNSAFFQSGSKGNKRVSDAMFINYWWDEQMLANSKEYAAKLNRSPYELYFGVDLSPNRNAQRIYTNAQWLEAIFPDDGNKALSSIALFANDVNFTFTGNSHTKAFSAFKEDPEDYRNFYDHETRLFSGDELNLLSENKDLVWPGLGRYVPAKSTLNQLPFSTSFNTGHGKFKATLGKLLASEWHDVAQQDILPTWQFALTGNAQTNVYYDFEQPYSGGSSLAIRSKATSNEHIAFSNLPLYQTEFSLAKATQVEVVFRYNSVTKAMVDSTNILATLWLETTEKKRIEIPLSANDNQWTRIVLPLINKTEVSISRIGFHLTPVGSDELSINIGFLEIK